MALPLPARGTLLFKTPDEFTLMRKGEAKIADLRNITTGHAIYGADIKASRHEICRHGAARRAWRQSQEL